MNRLLDRLQSKVFDLTAAVSPRMATLVTQTRLILGICGILCLGTLLADLSLDLGMILAFPYALCILATLWIPGRWNALVMASAVSFLCLLGLALGDSFGRFPVTQRLLVLFATWATAGVVLMRRAFHHELNAQETLLGLVADQSPIMIWMSDAHENRTYYNARWLSFVGSTLEQEVEQDPFERVHPADYDRCFDAYADAYQDRAPFQIEYRLLCHDGEYSRVLDTACPRFSHNGQFEGYVGFCKDLTDRMRIERTQRGRSLALEKIASRRELPEILSTLVETAESVSPDLRCVVAVLDEDGQRFENVVGASMPAFYRIILGELEVGPNSESLGQSVLKKQRIVVEDVQTHPDWEAYRDYATRAEFRTCWAEPIIGSNGQPIGAIGMFFRRARVPDSAELEFVRAAASMATIALEGDKDRSINQLNEAKQALCEAQEMVAELEQNLSEVSQAYEVMQESPNRGTKAPTPEEPRIPPAPAVDDSLNGQEPVSSAPATAQVLVIDSSDEFVFRTTDMLRGLGSVSSAENGPLAINMVRSSFRRGVPYHVILVHMDRDGFDGQEIIEQIRAEGFLGTIATLGGSPETPEDLSSTVPLPFDFELGHLRPLLGTAIPDPTLSPS